MREVATQTRGREKVLSTSLSRWPTKEPDKSCRDWRQISLRGLPVLTSAKLSYFLTPPPCHCHNSADFVSFVCFLGTSSPTHCKRHIWKPPWELLSYKSFSHLRRPPQHKMSSRISKAILETFTSILASSSQTIIYHGVIGESQVGGKIAPGPTETERKAAKGFITPDLKFVSKVRGQLCDSRK